MDDAEAIELIDAHLDRLPLTDEQSDALTAWIKENPQRADEAFYRIFLHSYLRMRLQAGGLPETFELSAQEISSLNSPDDEHGLLAAVFQEPPRKKQTSRWNRKGFFIGGLLAILAAICCWGIAGIFHPARQAGKLYAYEGFIYPGTVMPEPKDGVVNWPTTGGLQGLAGGHGWEAPWQETNSKVGIIVDYDRKDMIWQENDMRKFGPLGYTDLLGNVLLSSGNQMRTATSPRSITTREFDLEAFPESMKDEDGLGRDGSVLWLSFLAQSAFRSAERNRYSYLMIGSKEEAGLRIGKLGAAPSGNWTAVAMHTGAEVNLRSSIYSSGEMVFFVVRVIFRPGPEDAFVWINPKLNDEPVESEAALHLPVPDFRFLGVAIHANHSSDFDEIRFGGSFRAVAPLR